MSDTFQTILDFLNSIERLPALALVALSSTVFGYVLRCFKRFPNDGIPVAVVCFAVIANWFLAPPRTGADTVLAWRTRQVVVGLIVGWLTWQLHARILKKLEDRMPWVKDLFDGQ